METTLRKALLAVAMCLALAGVAAAQEVSFDDPTGDDNGPGSYVYPTDSVYTGGSFDITNFTLKAKGKKANVEVSVNSNLEDPWGMGVGFAVQMVFIFIDNAEGGFTKAPPGLNVEFAESDAWDKCIILSPQTAARVREEVENKAGDMASAIVVPARVRGAGRTISASVSLEDLGEGDPSTWGYQVLMQSNEGFPKDGDLLTRKVNEYEGQHRFGGGTDYDCDPHVMDILGDQAMLAYECNDDGTAKKAAVLKMVRK